jgi:hypothetical protein
MMAMRDDAVDSRILSGNEQTGNPWDSYRSSRIDTDKNADCGADLIGEATTLRGETVKGEFKRELSWLAQPAC